MSALLLLGTDGNQIHANGYEDSASRLDFRQTALSLQETAAFNASSILAMEQQHIVQYIATSISSISLAAAVCAIYWFCMMRRNFRRDLVLLLILGGSWKSLWFVVFSAKTFTTGPIATNAIFCQASGYMLQVGFEMCDAAVVFMSMHMYLQIFPPRRFTFFGHDGLYRARKWVVALWFLLPLLSASLAFVNPGPAYMAQGGFCSLPYRPMWYRLALFWIPRYLVWIYIFCVAVRIYFYVGREFKVFGQERDSSTSRIIPTNSSLTIRNSDPEKGEGQNRSSQLLASIARATDEGDNDTAPDDISSIRKSRGKSAPSSKSSNGQKLLPGWAAEFSDLDQVSNPFGSRSKSTPTSRRGSRQAHTNYLSEDFALPPTFDPDVRRNSTASFLSANSVGAVSGDGQLPLEPTQEVLPASAPSERPKHSANHALRMRRRAITRQLKLLFIYPVFYLLLWIIPFVVNLMNYSDYWVQHSIFSLKVLQVASLTIMTLVDVVVFSWRERPWRHIPGSDGTFVGSFMWWRFCFGGAWSQSRRQSRAPTFVPGVEGQAETEGFFARMKQQLQSRTISTPPVSGRPSLRAHSRTFSGGSDRRHLEAERAHERLALERAEYEANRKSLNERRASVLSTHLPSSTSPAKKPERKEWFDMMESKDGTQMEEEDEVEEQKQ